MRVINGRKHPFDVLSSLVELGIKISSSRRARQITQQELGDRSGLSRKTIVAIEKGSPDVSIGNYMSALWAMNLHTNLTSAIDHDTVAVQLMAADLPQRVRR